MEKKSARRRKVDVLCVWELFSSVFAKAFAVEGKREAGQVEDREGRKGVISDKYREPCVHSS